MKRGTFVVFAILILIFSSVSVNADLVDWFTQDHAGSLSNENQITGLSFFGDFFNSIGNFFKKLLGQEQVGFAGSSGKSYDFNNDGCVDIGDEGFVFDINGDGNTQDDLIALQSNFETDCEPIGIETVTEPPVEQPSTLPPVENPPAAKVAETQACVPGTALTGDELLKNLDKAEPKGVIDLEDLIVFNAAPFDADGNGCVDLTQDGSVYAAKNGETYVVAAAENHNPMISSSVIAMTVTDVLGTVVPLQGVATDADGDTLVYKWEKGTNVIDADGVFTADAGMATNGKAQFKFVRSVIGKDFILTVTDGKGGSATKTIMITFSVKQTTGGQQTFTCTGITPENANLCVGDNIGLTVNTLNVLGVGCNPNVKCEYTCLSTHELKDGKCVVKAAQQPPAGGQPITYTEAMVKKADYNKDGKITSEDYTGGNNPNARWFAKTGVYGTAETDLSGDGKTDDNDAKIISKMIEDGASYTLPAVTVGIDAAGSKLNSRPDYLGANVRVKLFWDNVKLQEGDNLVSANAVYDNEITGLGVWDSIKNFFANLFGTGTRGARLTTPGGQVIEMPVYYRIERIPAFTGGVFVVSGVTFIVKNEIVSGCEDGICEYIDAAVTPGTPYTYKVRACLDDKGTTKCSKDYIGTVTITPKLPDFDGNGCVDICDVGVLAKALNSKLGESKYDNRVELTFDNSITFEDFFVIGGFYNKQTSCASPSLKALIPDLAEIQANNPGNDAQENPKWIAAVVGHEACKKAVSEGFLGQPGYDESCKNPVMIKEKGKRASDQMIYANGKLACGNANIPNKFCMKIQQWGGSTTWEDVSYADANGKPEPSCDMNSGFGMDAAYVACCSATANQAPVVRFTNQLNGAIGQQITLDGSGSSDPESGKTALKYLWEQLDTPPGSKQYLPAWVGLTGAAANTAQTKFTPSKEGVYTFRFTVTDNQGASSSDIVSVNIGMVPDFDDNKCVDYCDYLTFTRVIGKKTGEYGFIALADFDKNGVIDQLLDSQSFSQFKKQGDACKTADQRSLPSTSPLPGFDRACDLKQIITTGNKLEATFSADKQRITFKWNKIKTKLNYKELEDGVYYSFSRITPGNTQPSVTVVSLKTPTDDGYTCLGDVCQYTILTPTTGNYVYNYVLVACLDKEGKDCTSEMANAELNSQGQLDPNRIEVSFIPPDFFYDKGGTDSLLTFRIDRGVIGGARVSFFNQNGYSDWKKWKDNPTDPKNTGPNLSPGRDFVKKDASSQDYISDTFSEASSEGTGDPPLVNYYYFIELLKADGSAANIKVLKADGSAASSLGSLAEPYLVYLVPDAPGGYDKKFDLNADGCVDKKDELAYNAALLTDLDNDGKKNVNDTRFFTRYLKKNNVNNAQGKVCKCTAADQCLDPSADLSGATACFNQNQLNANSSMVCGVNKKAKECVTGDDYETNILGKVYCCSNAQWTNVSCAAPVNLALKPAKQEVGFKGNSGKNPLIIFDRTGLQLGLELNSGTNDGSVLTIASAGTSVSPATKTLQQSAITKTAMKYIQIIPEDNRLENVSSGLVKSANLTFAYGDAEIASGSFLENTLQIYWFNNTDGNAVNWKWQNVPQTLNIATNTINVTLNHLSIFALAGDTSVGSATPPTPPAQPPGGPIVTGPPGGRTSGGSSGAGGFVSMKKGEQCIRIGQNGQKSYEALGYVRVNSCTPSATTGTLPKTTGTLPRTGGTLPRTSGTLPELAGGDSDDDGLLDSWEMNFFGDLEQGFNDDYDNDGFVNGEEYANNSDPTDADSPGKSNTWIWMVIFIIFIAAVAGLFFWMRKKKRKISIAPEKEKNNDGFLEMIRGSGKKEVNPKIMDYVNKAKKSGYSKETIKNNLLSVGWDREQIDQAIEDL
ncbi:MAG TPA: hypothetical protein VJJ21_03550 [Candidatus Nanoarchaeia archaeon]|nr:hypothetical protein [Candidatus Nanoarchaeia archaeon]